MKKISLSFLALVFALVIPFSSADAAGNGQWDLLGSYEATYNSTYGFFETANVYSTGGGFKIGAYPNGDGYWVKLWESDPGSGNDDYIGKTYLSRGDEDLAPNMNRYVDGSNNRAELYVTSEDPEINHDLIYFWD